jgi:Zn-dependent protease
MFITQLLTNPILAIFYLCALVIAISVHEFAHAKVADKLGDPTPDLDGRITLNPLAHLDPLGSVLFLLVGFGWGKPVRFDPFNLENPRRDAALISLAGPASNAIMAITAAFMHRLLGTSMAAGAVTGFLEIFIWINVVLGIFNLLPFAPLDGFKIVGGILPEDKAMEWYGLEKYGYIFLLFFIFPFVGGRSMLEVFVSPIISFIVNLLV